VVHKPWALKEEENLSPLPEKKRGLFGCLFRGLLKIS
jgi:hypothetical protein